MNTVITDKGSYSTDLVILAIGVHPTTRDIKDSGIETIKNGAIVVNSPLETNVEVIYAARRL